MHNINQADFGTNYGADASTSTTPITLNQDFNTPSSIGGQIPQTMTQKISSYFTAYPIPIGLAVGIVAWFAYKHFKK